MIQGFSLGNRSFSGDKSFLDKTNSFDLTTDNTPTWLQNKNFEDSILSSSYKLKTVDFPEKYAKPVRTSSKTSPPKSYVNVGECLINHELNTDYNNNYRKKTDTLAEDNDAFAIHDNMLLQRYKVSPTSCKSSLPMKERSIEYTSKYSSSFQNLNSPENIKGRSSDKESTAQKIEEIVGIKLFYQKKIGDLESSLEKRDRKITSLKDRLIRQQNNVAHYKLDFDERDTRLNKSGNSDLNKSLLDAEKLVADNERDIMKAKEILIYENQVLKENTERLNESMKETVEMEDAAFRERDECLVKQEEYRLWINRLRSEMLEKDLRLAFVERENLKLSAENSKLSAENRELQITSNDMFIDASETSRAIVMLKAKLDEYKTAIETIDSDKNSELMESEIRNKEKLIVLETSMNKKFQIFRNDFSEREAKYKSFLENHALEMKDKEIEIRSLNDKLEEESLEAKQKISQMEEIISNLQGKYNLDVTEYSERLGQQKLKYEDKLKGVLSLTAKVELEDTIESMRQQIEILQSEKSLLEDELGDVTKFNLTCRIDELAASETIGKNSE